MRKMKHRGLGKLELHDPHTDCRLENKSLAFELEVFFCSLCHTLLQPGRISIQLISAVAYRQNLELFVSSCSTNFFKNFDT